MLSDSGLAVGADGGIAMVPGRSSWVFAAVFPFLATQALRVGCECGGQVPPTQCLGAACGTPADDAGGDAGTSGEDSGEDAGADAGVDAGDDAGADAGFDAGTDAGHDAGFVGAFSITGVTGNTDGVADGWLATTLEPTANWGAAAGASTYEVVIRDAADTVDACSAQSTTATSYDFAGCVLVDGASYLVKVTGHAAAGASGAASNDGFAFTVDALAPTSPVFTTPTVNVTTFAPTYTFAWTCSDSGSGLNLASPYLVERFATSGCGGAPASSGTQTAASFDCTAMVPGAVYSVQVTAYDNAGNVSATTCSPDVAFDAAPTLSLADPVTGSSTTATHQSVDAVIGNDLGAAKWCLSEAQSSAPTSGVTACAGGTGPSGGWFTARPASVTLSTGDGSKTVYLWLADGAGNVNSSGASKAMALTGAPPPLVFDSHPKKISSLHKAGTRLTGRCTEVGGAVLITGGGTGSTTCAAGGSWAVNANFASAADGTVAVSGVQWTASGALSSVPVAHQYVKDAVFCDTPANAGAAPFASGSGALLDPYYVCSTAQLLQLASSLSSSVRLRNDVDLTAMTWAGIGCSGTPYTGTFDGNDFIVENLTNTTGPGGFGFVCSLSGTVENVGMENVNISCGSLTGAIAGLQNAGGVIRNCYSTGVIQTTGSHIGGLVGQEHGDITRSYSTVTLNGTGSAYAIGGLRRRPGGRGNRGHGAIFLLVRSGFWGEPHRRAPRDELRRRHRLVLGQADQRPGHERRGHRPDDRPDASAGELRGLGLRRHLEVRFHPVGLPSAQVAVSGRAVRREARQGVPAKTALHPSISDA